MKDVTTWSWDLLVALAVLVPIMRVIVFAEAADRCRRAGWLPPRTDPSRAELLRGSPR